MTSRSVRLGASVVVGGLWAGALPAFGQCELEKLGGSGQAALDAFGSAVSASGELALVGAPLHDAAAPNAGATFLCERDDNGTPSDLLDDVWNEVEKLLPGDLGAGDGYGSAVAISGLRAVVGAPEAEHAGSGVGAAFVFLWSGTEWIREAKLATCDGFTGDGFGTAVGVFGDTVVVGANGDDQGGTDAGAVHVFRFDGLRWYEEVKLLASDAAARDAFGSALRIQGDLTSTTLVVGAPEDDDNGGNSGSAYVFARDDNGTPLDPFDDSWCELPTKLLASDGAAGDLLGASVDVSSDGQTVVVGAPEDDTGGTDTGSAYVWVRRDAGTSSDPCDDTFVQLPELVPVGFSSGDGFGTSVVMAADGLRLGAGAPGDDSGGPSGAGSVRVYDRNDNGTSSDPTDDTWTETAALRASDSAADDAFGTSVTIDADGDVVVVGVPAADDTGADSGSVYAYAFDGTGWNEEAKLTAALGAAGDAIGSTVALDDLTGLFVTGAPATDGAVGLDEGAGRSFFRFAGAWSELGALEPSTGAFYGEHGSAVAISGDLAVVGAPRGEHLGSDVGSVFVYEQEGTTWVRRAVLTACNGQSGDDFGGSVAVWEDTIVVGARRSSETVPGGGLVHVFERTDSGTPADPADDVWLPTALLFAFDAEEDDEFGSSVAISDTGAWILVGASFADVGGTNSGTAYAYVRIDPGTPSIRLDDDWQGVDRLSAPDGSFDDEFGCAVATTDDLALIGAGRHDGPGGENSGAAYVFTRTDTGVPGDPTDDSWDLASKLTASDGEPFDRFGESVDLSDQEAVVGAPFASIDGLSAGAAYVFDGSGQSWTQTLKLFSSDGELGDEFGGSVGLAGGTALVGAVKEDPAAGANAGSVYSIALLPFPSACAVSPSQIPAVTVDGPGKVRLHGTGFTTTTDVVVDGISLGAAAPPPQFQILSDTELELDFPLVSQLGLVPIQVQTPQGNLDFTIDVIPNDPPALEWLSSGEFGDPPVELVSTPGGLNMTLGSDVGDFVWLNWSTELGPSNLPGIVSLDVGNGFQNFVFVGLGQIPANGYINFFAELNGSLAGITLHFQLSVLDVSEFPNWLPLDTSNVESGLFLF